MKLWQAMLTRVRVPEARGGTSRCAGTRRHRTAPVAGKARSDYLRAYRQHPVPRLELVEVMPTEDDKSRQQMRFLARRITDALAPPTLRPPTRIHQDRSGNQGAKYHPRASTTSLAGS